jgi:hypothetical protein
MTKQDHNVEMKLSLKTKVKKFGNQQRFFLKNSYKKNHKGKEGVSST